MVKYYNAQGQVRLTEDLFASLVGIAASRCFGVADMSRAGTMDDVKTALFSAEREDRGVQVTEQDGELVIHLHIKVMYGVNIPTVVQNLHERVIYAVQNLTGLPVKRVHVFVDDILTD